MMNEDSSVYSYSNAVRKEIDTLYPTKYKAFTEEDYKNLQRNIILYKQGDPEAANYIIAVFHKFIKKYADFICGVKAPKGNNYYSYVEVKRDKSLAKFVKLFISTKKRTTAPTKKERDALFSEACAKIRKLFSKFDYWDIYNELVCALLYMANKYKITQPGDKYYKINGTFHVYVNKCFHFDAYNTLKKIIGDPLSHVETYGIEEDTDLENNSEIKWIPTLNNKSQDNPECSFNYTIKSVVLKDTDTDKLLEHIITRADRDNKIINNTDKLILKENNVDPYEMESLNFNWTNGVTCGEEFKNLSSYEREILVLSFAQNKTDGEIADIYGCHRITIVKHKKIAVQKIRDAMLRKEKEGFV